MEKKEESKRKRSENWNEEDKMLLKELVRERVQYIENKNTDTETNQAKKEAWMDIEENFNKLCTGGRRSLAQLKNQWVAIKVFYRKQQAEQRKDFLRSTGGSKLAEITASSDDIFAWLPTEYAVDYNQIDSDSIFKKVEQEDTKSNSFLYEDVPSDSEENFPYTETTEMSNFKKRAEKRGICQNFTVYEEDILVSLVEKYQDIIESKETDRETFKQKQTTWQRIEQEFCALADTYRTTKMLKEKYDQIKVKTRQIINSQSRKAHSSTEDSTCSRSTQLRSSITNRMAAILTKSGSLQKSNNFNYFDENTSGETSNENYSETGIKCEIEEIKLEDNNTTNSIQNDELQPITADDVLHITVDEEENKNSLSWHPANTISSKSPPLNNNNTSELQAELKLSNNSQSAGLFTTTEEEKTKNVLPCRKSYTRFSKPPSLNNISMLADKAKLKFFQNEEVRAAERHLWEKEFHDKRLMYEMEIKKKKLELLNLQIENARNQYNK